MLFATFSDSTVGITYSCARLSRGGQNYAGFSVTAYFLWISSHYVLLCHLNPSPSFRVHKKSLKMHFCPKLCHVTALFSLTLLLSAKYDPNHLPLKLLPSVHCTSNWHKSQHFRAGDQSFKRYTTVLINAGPAPSFRPNSASGSGWTVSN